jgi:HK97 family phage major capsid protein/HK97 family phage prohead protease
MLKRAYSLLDIKAVDDATRTITGMASTPEPDRMGDVVEPKGAKFKLPIPLLWQHRSDQPIGLVTEARVTPKGIEIKAEIASVDEPGDLKTRLDTAYQTIKAGLVRGLSIGFRSLEDAYDRENDGFHILRWEWLELSCVTIPANAGAEILSLRHMKQFDVPASGTDSTTSPGVSGALRTPVRSRNAMAKKTYAEQILDIKAQIQTKQSDLEAIQTKVTEEGRTKDAGERESFDAMSDEIDALEGELKDFERLDARAKSAAKPAAGTAAAARETARANVVPFQHVSIKSNRDAGIGFARLVMCKMAAFMTHYEQSAESIAKSRYPHDEELHLAIKNTIAGGITTDSTWAQPLAYPALANEFVEYARPMSILGKFGTTVGGVTYPALMPVPFNVKINRETSVPTGYWVGEGKPVPVSKEAFDAITMGYTKVGALTIISRELARFSSPSAEAFVRNALVKSTVAKLDSDLINPDTAAVSNVNPASLTNGLTGLTTAGTSADNVRTDIIKLIAAFQQPYNLDPSNLVLVMPNTLCMALSVLATSLGTKQFPTMGITGGYLEGVPVIGSQYAASGASYGNMVIGIDTSSIGLADDNEVSVDISTEAALQMLDNPTNAASDGTATTMVSLWQTNSIGIKTERFINWQKLRTGAVAFFDDVNWGSVGSPY